MDEKGVKSRLQAVLEAYDMNCTKLHTQFGVNQKTLNNQINSNTAVSLSTILLISKVFPEVSLEWLLRGTGEMRLNPTGVVFNHSKINNIVDSENTTVSDCYVNGALAEKDALIAEKDKRLAEKDEYIALLKSQK